MDASDPIKIAYQLNGRPVTAEVEPRSLLVHHLREDRRLVGAHVGCDTSQCGACAVLVDGRAVKSCTMLAVQVDGADVVTVEGIGGPDGMHPVQDALHRHHGAQCGFCTPGMVACAVDMLANPPAGGLSEKAIRHGLAGNICRCTGYQNIVEAIAEVAGVPTGASA